VPSDLVSGPDLGGGYLHQLSRDSDGTTTTFTFHAQAGGADANGPPIGPLDPFGFVRPPTPCMFGGPKCWHRRFLLPPEEALRVRSAYNRNRFVLDTMLRQAQGEVPVDIEAGLPLLVERLTAALDPEGIEWYIGGSTAVRLLGGSLAPRDIDLGSTRAGVDRIAEALREYLIEPLAPTDWPASGIVRGARAFLGTFHAGVRVEWAVPIEPREALPFEEWSGRPGVARRLAVSFRGRPLWVTRPEYALVRAAAAGRTDRLGPIAAVIRAQGVDRELLEALLERSKLPVGSRDAVRASTRPDKSDGSAGVPLEP